MIIEILVAALIIENIAAVYLGYKQLKNVKAEIAALKTKHDDIAAKTSDLAVKAAKVLESKVVTSQGTAICSKCNLHVARFRVNADGSTTCKNCEGK